MDDLKSLFGVFLAVGILFVIAFGLCQIPTMLADLADSRASQLQAQAELERAESMREHQQSQDWQREFELYSVTLAAYLGSHELTAVFLAFVCGVLGAIVAIWGLERIKFP